jgi:hypothetical protein
MRMNRGSRFIPRDQGFEGWTDREQPDGWIATWMAPGSDDSIEPGLHRDVLMDSVGNRSIQANVLDQGESNGQASRQCRDRIGDDPDRPQTITVTWRADLHHRARRLRLPPLRCRRGKRRAFS